MWLRNDLETSKIQNPIRKSHQKLIQKKKKDLKSKEKEIEFVYTHQLSEEI